MNHINTINLVRSDSSYRAGFCMLYKEEVSPEKWLHVNELQYLHTLKYEERRRSYILGRTAAKKAILSLYPNLLPNDIWIDFGIFGFPVVKCTGLENIKVSISHCQHVATAVAYPEDHPLGIDVEFIDPEQLTVIASQVQDSERDLIETLPISKIAAYTALWSVKEALSKIFMTGLTMNLDLLALKEFKHASSYYQGTFENAVQYQSVTFFSRSYVLSIVIPLRTTLSFAGTEELFMSLLD
jgi:4'-phosphopantetheinyl transferase